ncbi:MAG: anaerobic ribonucleoside-triphosphate reductase activating protein [Candidatus Cloacimonadaceae bacterium]
MIIGGFQRFSLLDYPGHLAAIVFTQGCNFRCPYCHNPELVDPQRYGTQIPVAEVLEFLKGRKGKLGAVCITGGEPTLQRGLVDFLQQVRKLGYLIKLDTNGSNPKVLRQLSQLNLVDYWAMDLKGPLHLYPLLCRSEIDRQNIQESMEILRQSGSEYEFRTTFFETLLTWEDIDQVRILLKPGDRFFLQQCRYEKTLDNLKPAQPASTREDGSLHLVEHPSCQSLLDWAGKHQVNIGIRSL